MQNPLITHLSPWRDPFLPSFHLVDPSLLSLSFHYQLSLLPLSLPCRLRRVFFLLLSSSSPPCMFSVGKKREDFWEERGTASDSAEWMRMRMGWREGGVVKWVCFNSVPLPASLSPLYSMHATKAQRTRSSISHICTIVPVPWFGISKSPQLHSDNSASITLGDLEVSYLKDNDPFLDSLVPYLKLIYKLPIVQIQTVFH